MNLKKNPFSCLDLRWTLNKQITGVRTWHLAAWQPIRCAKYLWGRVLAVHQMKLPNKNPLKKAWPAATFQPAGLQVPELLHCS